LSAQHPKRFTVSRVAFPAGIYGRREAYTLVGRNLRRLDARRPAGGEETTPNGPPAAKRSPHRGEPSASWGYPNDFGLIADRLPLAG